ncbi:MAG: FliH/SctL family protein [Chitinispirillaceae bacterium]
MSEEETYINENVSVLLEKLLESKDPATIGVRRILRRRVDQKDEFPLRTPQMESFDQSGNQGASALSEDEVRVVELEKKVGDLEKTIAEREKLIQKAAQEAYRKGKQEGLAEGTKKGEETAASQFSAQIKQIEQRMSSFLQQVECSKKEMIHNLDRVLLGFCLEISKKVVASEVQTREDIVLSVVKKSLGFIAEKDKLIIRISPRDEKIVSQRQDFWSSITERLENVIIEPDDRIEKGGCIIESNSGMVDARLGVQMEEIEELVQKAWENSDLQDETAESPQ